MKHKPTRPIGYDENVDTPNIKEIAKEELDANREMIERIPLEDTPDNVEDIQIGDKCICGWQPPYGFVPEADCPLHDTARFYQFIKAVKAEGAREALQKGANEVV